VVRIPPPSSDNLISGAFAFSFYFCGGVISTLLTLRFFLFSLLPSSSDFQSMYIEKSRYQTQPFKGRPLLFGASGRFFPSFPPTRGRFSSFSIEFPFFKNKLWVSEGFSATAVTDRAGRALQKFLSVKKRKSSSMPFFVLSFGGV